MTRAAWLPCCILLWISPKSTRTAEAIPSVNATCVVQLRGSTQAAIPNSLLLAQISCVGNTLVQVDIDPMLAPFTASFTGLPHNSTIAPEHVHLTFLQWSFAYNVSLPLAVASSTHLIVLTLFRRQRYYSNKQSGEREFVRYYTSFLRLDQDEASTCDNPKLHHQRPEPHRCVCSNYCGRWFYCCGKFNLLPQHSTNIWRHSSKRHAGCDP